MAEVPPRAKLTAGNVADAILFLAAIAPLVWWTAWLLVPARLDRPLDFFPFGATGYVFISIAAVAAAGALWRLSISGYSPVPSAPLDRGDGAALGAALAMAAALWEKALFRGWTPVNGLFLYVFHPAAALSGEALQNGHLPLWNPWANGGMPLMADPLVGSFAPLHLLLHLFHVPAGMKIWLPAATLLLFTFTYLWLRDRHLGPAASFTGGVAAAFGAYAVWHAAYLPHLESLLWLPAVMHGLERRSFKAVSLAAAQQLLSGHYQFAYMTILCVAVLFIVEKAPLRRWGWAAGAAGTAGFLAAFQLLPTWELVRLSTRRGALAYGDAVRFSQPPLQLAKMIFLPLWIRLRPAFQGDPAIVVFYGSAAVLGLAVIAFVRRRASANARLGAVLALVGVFLSLGQSNPVYPFLFRFLPGLSLFRFPAQWMGLALFGSALLAAQGAEALPPRRRWAAGALLAAELFLFHGKEAYLWVDPSFLSDRPPALDGLRAAGGRVMETPAVEAWRYGDLPSAPSHPDFAGWTAVKNALMISQGTPFHLREAKSITNHVPAGAAALQGEAGRGGDAGLAALRQLGVTRLLDVRDPAALAPDFHYLRVDGALPLCRTSTGDPVSAAVEDGDWNAKVIRLSRPWEGGGPLVLGETFFPGWTARAEEGRRPTGPSAGGPFRRVELEKGDREVRLRYDAPLFFIGMFLSLFTVVGLALAPGSPVTDVDLFSRSGGLSLAAVFFILKGGWDFWRGEPYSNLFAPVPWDFVSIHRFVLFAGAEVLAGSGLGLWAWCLFKFSQKGNLIIFRRHA